MDTFLKVTREIAHWSFTAWGGGLDHWKEMDFDERETFFQVMADIYPEGIDETTLNDILWFDWDWVQEVIGRTREEEEEE